MGTSQWENIFTHLQSHGFTVYPPATKKGDCLTPYIVVKHAGEVKVSNISSKTQLFDLLLYVPQNQYSQLDHFVEKVEAAMKELWPKIRPIFSKTPPFLDSSNKSWMVSIQYKNYCKIHTF